MVWWAKGSCIQNSFHIDEWFSFQCIMGLHAKCLCGLLITHPDYCFTSGSRWIEIYLKDSLCCWIFLRIQNIVTSMSLTYLGISGIKKVSVVLSVDIHMTCVQLTYNHEIKGLKSLWCWLIDELEVPKYLVLTELRKCILLYVKYFPCYGLWKSLAGWEKSLFAIKWKCNALFAILANRLPLLPLLQFWFLLCHFHQLAVKFSLKHCCPSGPTCRHFLIRFPYPASQHHFSIHRGKIVVPRFLSLLISSLLGSFALACLLTRLVYMFGSCCKSLPCLAILLTGARISLPEQASQIVSLAWAILISRANQCHHSGKRTSMAELIWLSKL